jgi:hypothetical protein
MDKPPLGIMPRKIWDDRRYFDLVDAINRYVEAKIDPPQEWLDEFSEILWRNYG